MKIIKALRFVFYPLYIISFFIKREKSIWVFGAHQNRFCENSRALYEYANKSNDNIKVIWITGDKNLLYELQSKKYLSYHRWSIKGLYFSLKAKYYFYNVYSDDINFYTAGNAILVNLWHGIPLKQIEFDIKKGPLKKIFNSNYSFIYRFFKPYLFRSPNYVLSTSNKVSKIFSSSLKVSVENCLELGYPRTDIFYKVESSLEKEKTIIYMPTWRSLKSNILFQAIEDFDKLNRVLEKKQLKFLIKLHPNESMTYKNYSNIEFIDSKVDIYDLLPLSDYLITDYSSVYFDYLLLDKEIIFYPFDLKEYLKKDRDFYFDYEENTPGKKVYNYNELLLCLSNIEHLDFKEKREKIRNSFFIYQDGNASKRVYDYFKGLD